MNDNDADAVLSNDVGQSPLPYGYAAYLLIESLLHELIARGAISTEDAIGIVGIAIDTNVALADSQTALPTRSSAELLERLSLSLRADVSA
ncbi:hypothetical protein [Sphingomonas sp. RS2018]